MDGPATHLPAYSVATETGVHTGRIWRNAEGVLVDDWWVGRREWRASHASGESRSFYANAGTGERSIVPGLSCRYRFQRAVRLFLCALSGRNHDRDDWRDDDAWGPERPRPICSRGRAASKRGQMTARKGEQWISSWEMEEERGFGSEFVDGVCGEEDRRLTP